jgi:hypothetical protein
MNIPNTKDTEQVILNSSFDPTYGTLVFQPMGYDGTNLRRPTADSLQIKIVEDSGYTYICFAAPGIAVATDKWRIFRIDETGNLLFADGNDNFDNVATDPTALTYTYD